MKLKNDHPIEKIYAILSVDEGNEGIVAMDSMALVTSQDDNLARMKSLIKRNFSDHRASDLPKSLVVAQFVRIRDRDDELVKRPV